MKKILIPTDFSTPATWAMETAMIIARQAKSTIILLHIVEQPTKESFNVEGEVFTASDWEDKIFTAKLIQKSKAQLQKAADTLRAGGIDVIQELRLGNPYHGMHAMIAEHTVDLVVMGTAGHSRFEDIFIGSNTEKVVRYAKSPVLSVHQKPSGTDFKNIVYATSLNEDEKAFVPIVKKVQEMFGSTIHLVKVNTPANFSRDTQTRKSMKDFVAKHKITNCTQNIFNDFNPEEGILNFAASVNANLIAMTTHGRKGLRHVLAGSIAEDVVNQSVMPVLTFSI